MTESNCGGEIGENEIDGIKFQIATLSHRPALVEFLLDYFRVEEPITYAVGTTREDAVEFYDDLTDSGLKDEVSYVALDSASGRLVGCRLNEIVHWDPENPKHEKSPLYPHETANKIAGFIDDLSENLHDLLPDSRKMMKFVVVGVHPEYFRRGIGTKLVQLSLKKAKEVGCDWVTTTATALRSQNMFEKLGFVTLHQIEYANYYRNGELVFKYLHDGATAGKLMAKKLE